MAEMGLYLGDIVEEKTRFLYMSATHPSDLLMGELILSLISYHKSDLLDIAEEHSYTYHHSLHSMNLKSDLYDREDKLDHHDWDYLRTRALRLTADSNNGRKVTLTRICNFWLELLVSPRVKRRLKLLMTRSKERLCNRSKVAKIKCFFLSIIMVWLIVRVCGGTNLIFVLDVIIKWIFLYSFYSLLGFLLNHMLGLTR